MTYTAPTPTIWKTKNPIHIIRKPAAGKKSWTNQGMWLDFESGSKNASIPLTKAMKFNSVMYDAADKRIQIDSFKIVSIDALIEFWNAIGEGIKQWKKVL